MMLDVHDEVDSQSREIRREEAVTAYTGDYPDPRQLAAYEEAVSGSALHLLSLAAERQEKTLLIQAERQKTRNRNSTLGIVCAFVITGLTVLAGYYVMSTGATVEGLTLSGSGVAGLALAFIRSTDDPYRDENK